jgi:predicted naringenin-chalcone synthase
MINIEAVQNRPHTFCNIISSAIAVPDNSVSTVNLFSSLAEKMTDELRFSINQLGVDHRYSIIKDYPNYVAGNVERELLTNTTELGVQAIKECITSSKIDPSQICLLISITNTANRHFPCFGYEIISKLSDFLPSHINLINMQDQGCSVLLKGVEIAQHYLQSDPTKYVLIVASESHTGFVPQFTEKNYYGFRELIKQGANKKQLVDTMTLIESFLFGDGAVAFLLGVQPNCTMIGSITHLTNIEKSDTDLIHMDEGGILIPAYEGYPHYIMSSEVPMRGALYTEKGVESLLNRDDALFVSVDQADLCFIHTGSKKILNGICKRLHIDPTLEKVFYSYDVLQEYGNLSSASVGFMIQKCIKEKRKGKGLIISFGVGFSGSNGFIQFV